MHYFAVELTMCKAERIVIQFNIISNASCELGNMSRAASNTATTHQHTSIFSLSFAKGI